MRNPQVIAEDDLRETKRILKAMPPCKCGHSRNNHHVYSSDACKKCGCEHYTGPETDTGETNR